MKFILVILAVLLSACDPLSKEPTSLRLAFNAPPTTLDPRKSGDFISSTLICLIYEGLTRSLPGGEVEPALAEKIEVSPDGLTYTFTLRKSHWSDGHPVTAYDFEKSWKQILDPSFASPSAFLLFPIKNAEKAATRELGVETIGIQAKDDRTLRVELERPTPFFLSLTAFPLLLPAPAHLEQISGDVSNGPFLIEKHLSNRTLYLRKNPNFWNRTNISLDSIEIQMISDENTALQMFERGEIDWLGAPLAPLPPDSLHALQDKLQFIPMAASTLIAFNTQEFPFKHPNLRKALSLCLDRERIVSEITLAGQIPASRSLPPSLFDKPLKPLFKRPDLIKARALFDETLEKLGCTSSDFESITLYYKPGQVDKRLAQVLQREWKEALGFTMKIEQIDPKTHWERLHLREYKIALGAWIAQFHDPINLLDRYRLASNQKNFAGWENPHYQALLEEAAQELDRDKRLEILARAEEIFGEELPILILYHWSSPSLASPGLKSIGTTPSGGVLFERFSFNSP